MMKRMRGLDLLQALVDGREDVIEEALRLEANSAADKRDRERARPPDPPPPPQPKRAPPPVRSSFRQGLRQHLTSHQSLRQAIIVHEVLGPPKALRPD